MDGRLASMMVDPWAGLEGDWESEAWHQLECVCVWGRTLKAIAIIIEWGQANSGHSSAWKMKYFRVYFQLPPYLPKFLTGGKSTLMKKQAYYHNQYGLHACSSELHCA